MSERSSLDILKDKWSDAWNDAVRLWSPYVQLRNPIFCETEKQEAAEGLASSFAMIRLNDFSVVLSLRQIIKNGLENFPLEIMAHEAGHHVYCPADLADMGRMIGRIQSAIPGYTQHAAMIGNLYGDLLINDKLFREHGLRMDEVYKKIKDPASDRFWNFYMRTYEILWALPEQTLTTVQVETETSGDAILAARIIRNFSRDWIKGAGEFASVCYRYLLESSEPDSKIGLWMDAAEPGDGTTIPAGLTAVDGDDEVSGALPGELQDKAPQPVSAGKGRGGANYREPFQYGQILRAMGIDLSDREIAARYYRERAIPYLIKFPSRELPESREPMPEGLAEWEAGSPVEDLSLFDSMIKSPVLIPGYTTVERIEGTSKGSEPEREPVDLDIYIDSSGSMPDPAVNTSYLTLAGAVICLSALRSGSRVQATLWSGTNQFMMTNGFVRNEKEIMEILTGFYGGSTAFPIHVLRDTYADRKPGSRRVHILVISDDGVTTMFDNDEKGNSGKAIAAMALEKCGADGTFALNIYQMNKELKEAAGMGWDIYPVTDWGELMKFSRDFVKKHYGGKK
jgi:hypothetical protein